MTIQLKAGTSNEAALAINDTTAWVHINQLKLVIYQQQTGLMYHGRLLYHPMAISIYTLDIFQQIVVSHKHLGGF